MDSETYDKIVRKRRDKLFGTRRFNVQSPVDYLPSPVVSSGPAPWDHVRRVSETGKLPNIEALRDHLDHLDHHHNRLLGGKEPYMKRAADGELPPGDGVYALRYQTVLDDIGYDLYLRESQIFAAETYTKKALTAVYDMLKARHPNREEFASTRSLRGAAYTPAVIVQIITDDMGIDASEIPEIMYERTTRAVDLRTAIDSDAPVKKSRLE